MILYQLYKIGGGWITLRSLDSTAQAIRYANNYQGDNLGYRRVTYHLAKYGSYEFNVRNGKFINRIIKDETTY